MKTIVAITFAVLFVAGLCAALTGCVTSKTTTTLPNGTVIVSESSGSDVQSVASVAGAAAALAPYVIHATK